MPPERSKLATTVMHARNWTLLQPADRVDIAAAYDGIKIELQDEQRIRFMVTDRCRPAKGGILLGCVLQEDRPMYGLACTGASI